MTSHREANFVKGLWVDPTPMPPTVPHVDEVGCTSAPLESMAFHFNAHCAEYSQDFVLCKKESKDPAHCLKEGRKVTRCAQSLIEKLRGGCMDVWEKHWQCLDMNNHMLEKCRSEERGFNDCVLTKFVKAFDSAFDSIETFNPPKFIIRDWRRLSLRLLKDRRSI